VGALSGPGEGSRFEWKELLKPDLMKIVVSLLMPVPIALMATRRLENVVDFYWYLLTPMMPYWDGGDVTYIFNRYVILWIPIYLAACVVTQFARRRR
jgi:hypothetical protein